MPGSGGAVSQGSLFGDIDHPTSKAPDVGVTKRVLITVTTAPNPSEKHGETVCVAGIELGDVGPQNWVRLYPINLRMLRGGGEGFRKYDVVSVRCRPARNDPRVESWNLDVESIRVERSIAGWPKRAPLIEPLAMDTMCGLFRAVKAHSNARSLGLVRASEVIGLDLEPHPGWTQAEQRKIDLYVNQFDFLSTEEKTPLEAPRFKGWYRYRCMDAGCDKPHRQQILDWEFLAFQRHLHTLDSAALQDALRAKFLGEICAPDRATAFYVGNQAKRHHTYSILGMWYPRRSQI